MGNTETTLLTSWRIIDSHVANVFGHDYGKAAFQSLSESVLGLDRNKNLPFKVPINVAMEEPGTLKDMVILIARLFERYHTWVIRHEAYSHSVICACPVANCIAANRVGEVVLCGTWKANHIECVLSG